MNIEMITKIVVALVSIAGAILSGILIPLIKAKTTKEQREDVFEWVKIAVYAAEQMAAAGLIQLPKKEYVVNYINKKLEGKEIALQLSEEDLDTMIEAAVRELNIAQAELVGGK